MKNGLVNTENALRVNISKQETQLLNADLTGLCLCLLSHYPLIKRTVAAFYVRCKSVGLL